MGWGAGERRLHREVVFQGPSWESRPTSWICDKPFCSLPESTHLKHNGQREQQKSGAGTMQDPFGSPKTEKTESENVRGKMDLERFTLQRKHKADSEDKQMFRKR